MNPEQPQTDFTTQQPVQQPDVLPPIEVKNRSIKGPLLLMFAPAIVFICTLILYTIFNAIINGGATPPKGASASPFQATINVILFAIGGLSTISGLPCFIGGLVWLIKRKSAA